MNVEFETKFSVDVPEGTGKALASLITDFINGLSAIMPLPNIHAKVGDFRPDK